jgi:hypothetical protein
MEGLIEGWCGVDVRRRLACDLARLLRLIDHVVVLPGEYLFTWPPACRGCLGCPMTREVSGPPAGEAGGGPGNEEGKGGPPLAAAGEVATTAIAFPAVERELGSQSGRDVAADAPFGEGWTGCLNEEGGTPHREKDGNPPKSSFFLADVAETARDSLAGTDRS